MKEINGYLLVEVPEGQSYFDIYGSLSQQEVVYNKMTTPGKFKKVSISLPKGNYSIIGLAKDLTEEQWKGIVDGQIIEGVSYMAKDYENKKAFKRSATESGHSLLKANNLNPNTTLILKKIL